MRDVKKIERQRNEAEDALARVYALAFDWAQIPELRRFGLAIYNAAADREEDVW